MTAPAGLDALGLTNALVSLAQATGLFSVVGAHEPASPPATGLTAALWPQSIAPARRVSGLAATSARVEFMLRVYMPATTGALDSIDPAMITAATTMINVLTGDFTLGGTVFEVDLLGANGNPLAAKAGYVDQAGQLFRIMDITIPLVIDNVWAQAAGT
jgi:hypothetical protein